MGNRAVITFDENQSKNSLGVYLHWNGGPEYVYRFLEAADRYGIRGNEDPGYQLARFVQIVANFMGGTTSIGVDLMSNLDCDNGDNGVYYVTRSGGKTTVKHGKDEGIDLKDALESVKGQYDDMPEQIDTVNLPIFKKLWKESSCQ